MEETFRCPECWDKRWVETADEDDAPHYRPCRHCAPIQHRRWREGHHRQDHVCEECAAVRSGRATIYDYNPEGEYLGASAH
jgi:methylphosphotriester-DNA--protein-cysteine methyltransferase